jgi:Bacterial Ig-like domain (group 3)/Beta-propeller repeat
MNSSGYLRLERIREAAILIGFLLLPAASHAGTPNTGSGRMEAVLDRLPLAFEANAGQFHKQVRFFARAPGKHLFLTGKGMVLVLNKGLSIHDAMPVIRLEFAGASPNARLEGVDRLGATTNYFRAGTRITDVSNFTRVRHRQVYPGIDVVYYGNANRIEYDFVVSPGADVGRIRVQLSGHAAADISDSGDLVLATSAGELTLQKPSAYQEHDGRRIEVPVRYLLAKNELRLEVAAYDPALTLTIDPLLAYSTFVTGRGDDKAWAIALDGGGNAYVAGETSSTDFPLAGALQAKKAGTRDMFVFKLNAGGSELAYSTYIGGRNGSTAGKGIKVDAAGNAYVTGKTSSSDYPVTNQAYRTSKGSGDAGFVTKLGPEGNALVYSTFIPHGPGAAIALDSSGHAFVTGDADSSFDTTRSAFQRDAHGDFPKAYVAKLYASGRGLIYASFLAGYKTSSGNGIAVDATGHAYVAGSTSSSNFPTEHPFQAHLKSSQDAFLTKLAADGRDLVYSTYLGGRRNSSANAVAVDSEGNAYVAGTTYADDFPVLRAFQPEKADTSSLRDHDHSNHSNNNSNNSNNSNDSNRSVNQAFITKFDASGSSLVYSSYLGGPSCLTPAITSCRPNGDDDAALAIAVDAAGSAYLAGQARSVLFPQVDPIQPSLSPYGQSIPFVAKVQDPGVSTLIYSIALGTKDTSSEDGTATGVAVDAAGNAYVSGFVVNVFPTTAGAFQASPASFPSGASKAIVFKVAGSAGRFTTRLSVSNLMPTSADTITLTAVVTSGTPGGTVTFNDNGSVLAVVPVSGGVATFSTSLPAGVHELTAVYSGDGKASRPLFLPVTQATN